MAFDYSKLKGRIVEICGTRAVFANKMNKSERTISLKLSGKIPWRQNEIMDAIRILDLDVSDIQEYFFKAI